MIQGELGLQVSATASRRPMEPIVRSAEIDGIYRWSARRAWGAGPLIHWNCLNPSDADGKRDDPTMWRMMGFSLGWGFGSMVVTNTYPFISSTTDKLRAWKETWDWETFEGHGMRPWEIDKSSWSAFHHNLGIIGQCAQKAEASVAAWGAGVEAEDLQQLFDGARITVDTSEHDGFGEIGVPIEWKCLGTNGDGSPIHPLARGKHRVPDDAVLQPWPR